MEGMLVLVYNSSLDKNFRRKFKHRWDGPYIIHKRFTNGTYELKSMNGSLTRERIDGVRLKPYHLPIMSSSMIWLYALQINDPIDTHKAKYVFV